MKHSRHTFASEMIRAGISLPALMQVIGHVQIQTTMVYIQLTPRFMRSAKLAYFRARE